MKNFSKLLLLFSCVMVFAASTCEGEPSGPGGPASGETLYFNGKIYTVNVNQPWAEAMIVKDGRITLSSDWDVSELNPFIGLQNAVTRSPQALSLEEAIKAYTINPAYVMRQEGNVGSLETGKAADFIILDRNPFEIPANQISQIKVEETYLTGEVVFPL